MADKTSVRKRMYLENCIYKTSKNTLNVEIETKRGVAKATRSRETTNQQAVRY